MGLNISLLACRASSVTEPADVARLLFPRSTHHVDGAVDLPDTGWPPAGVLYVGQLGDLTLLSARDLMLFNPTKLNARYLKLAANEAYLFSQQNVRDMFAYGWWVAGALRRSLSVNPVAKVWEDIGEPLPFERPFWAGRRPAPPRPYPLPFHPLDMAEAALEALLGLGYEGPTRLHDAAAIAMTKLVRDN